MRPVGARSVALQPDMFELQVGLLDARTGARQSGMWLMPVLYQARLVLD
jgi:hypothetical protein